MKRHWVRCLIGVLCCLLSISLGACTGGEAGTGQFAGGSAVPTERIEHVMVDYVVARSIADLAAQSDRIITGRVVADLGVINMELPAKFPELANPSAFSIGQVYQVEVAETIKGEASESLLVVQYQGRFDLNGLPPTKERIERTIKAFRTIPLSTDKLYLMFLASTARAYAGYPKETLYHGPAHPWRFDLTDPNRVVIEDEANLGPQFFTPMSYEAFLKVIQNPGEGQETIYPPPQGMNPEPEGYPYPPP